MSDTIVLAGGGTGGHVYPMIAVAQAIARVRPDVGLLFVGTERGMETQAVPAAGFSLELLPVLPIRGGGVGGAARGALRAAEMLPASRRLLRQVGARAVFSVGGYAAGPVSLAARTLGVPVALLEPNSVIGLANLLMAPFVQRAYTAFRLTERHFAPAVVRATGVPIRPGFGARPARAAHARPLRVLVLGGSQGAKALNETLPHAFGALSAALPRRSFEVVHQCGRAHEASVRELYARAGELPVTVVPFIDDMPSALASADLVVGRSGAGAVSEICAIGRPSLLVPYPYASGDHQHINAQELSAAGAAICVPSAQASVERLTAELRQLFEDAAILPRMAQAARGLGRPDAADVIAADLLTLAGLADEPQSVGAGRARGVGSASLADSATPVQEVA